MASPVVDLTFVPVRVDLLPTGSTFRVPSNGYLYQMTEQVGFEPVVEPGDVVVHIVDLGVHARLKADLMVEPINVKIVRV